ncbi:MAG: Clp protease N-terminal domain-containing protein [Chloroflexota bacterium]
MTNKMERFTKEARHLLYTAQTLAEEMNHELISPKHLLWAMTKVEAYDTFAILEEFDIVDSKLSQFIKVKHPPYHQSISKIDLSAETKRFLELSVYSARPYNHYRIDTVHLLLGLIRVKSAEISEIFAHFDVVDKDIAKLAQFYLADTHYPLTSFSETAPPKWLMTILSKLGLTVDKR